MKLIPISLCAWTCLGAYRGYENYNEKYSEMVKKYSQKKEGCTPLFMYTSAMAEMIFTGVFYTCIPLSIFSAPKFEMMRLEMWVRGLKKEDLPRPNDYFFRI